MKATLTAMEMQARSWWRGLGLAMLLLVSLAEARPPDWAQPLLAENVAELGRGYRSVRLADLTQVTYGADQRKRTTYRGAIRVMTEQGRTRAQCVHLYNADHERILGAHAWVVSADGKRSDSYSIREFSDRAARYDDTSWDQQRELSFSAATRVEVGGALVWELETETQVSVFDHTTEFPRELPTLRCTLDVTPAPSGTLAWHASGNGVPKPTPGATAGSLHWEENRYDPPVGIDRPSGFLPTPRLVAVRAETPSAASPVRTWADMARLAHDLVSPRIAAGSEELRAKAVALAAGKSGRWDRVRAVAEFVQREITYLSITLDKDYLAGYRPHAAADVLGNRFGDCKDKATLLIAMLQAIGERGYPMLVFSGNPTYVLPEWPSPRFNHMIVALPADDAVPTGWPVVNAGPAGRVVLFDPTSTYVPLGVLPDDDQDGHGLLVSPEATALVRLPSGKDDYACTVTAVVDWAGNARIQATEVMSGNLGAQAYARRDIRGAEKFTRALETRLADSIASVSALKWSGSWSATDSRWRMECEFLAPRLGRRAGGLLLVSPRIIPAPRRLNPWKTGLPGVVWSSAMTLRETIRLTLPSGSVIEEMPEPWRSETPAVVGSVRYQKEGPDVVCTVEITLQPGFLEKPAYEAMRGFLLKSEEAVRRPIVVKAGEGLER